MAEERLKEGEVMKILIAIDFAGPYLVDPSQVEMNDLPLKNEQKGVIRMSPASYGRWYPISPIGGYLKIEAELSDDPYSSSDEIDSIFNGVKQLLQTRQQLIKEE